MDIISVGVVIEEGADDESLDDSESDLLSRSFIGYRGLAL
jgi:hypothetical protein